MLLVVCVYIFHVCILSYVLSLHHFVMCSICIHLFCFFFSSRRRHTSLRISDWSSDVCSSDLGIDVANVTAWFEANVAGASGPLQFDLIAGGHSNLTYGVTDAGGRRYVLRRPPLGQVLASAHDMGREHKIISALGSTDVPVEIGRANV